MSSTKLWVLGASLAILLHRFGHSFFLSPSTRTSIASVSTASRASRCSRPSRASPPLSRPSTMPPLGSTAQMSTVEVKQRKVKSVSFEEMKAKQKMATALADRYSRDFAKFYMVPGKASENPEFFRLYTFLAWKVDAFVDDFPEWKTFLGPEAKMVMPRLESLGSYAPRDVRKFGPVVDFLIKPQETYTELWDAVESSYGSDAFEIMAIVDKAMYLFIKYSDDIFISETPAKLMKKYPLEDYMHMRSWTGGTIPLAGYFWFGVDAPKDGRVEDACTACCLVNDLYDYQRDKDVAEQLSVWHYFDSIDDAIDYVRGYYYEVYDRVGPELQHFLDLTMMYQQDKKTHEIRGFDSEWYGMLNANFNRHLKREPPRCEKSHVDQWGAPCAL